MARRERTIAFIPDVRSPDASRQMNKAMLRARAERQAMGPLAYLDGPTHRFDPCNKCGDECCRCDD